MAEKETKFFKETSEVENTPVEEEIHVMHDYLKDKKVKKPQFLAGMGITKQKKAFPLWLIWVFLGLIFISFAAIFYFSPNTVLSLFGEKKTGGLVGNLPPSKEVKITNGIINTQSQPQVSPAETLRAELKEGDEIIIQAELYLPAGALPGGERLTLEGRPPLAETGDKYKVIDGVFTISPQTDLNKPLTLKIFYQEKNIEAEQEDDLKIGYFKEGFWIILPTEVDIEKNILSTNLSSLYSGTFAPLILEEKKTEKTTQEISPGVFLGEDSDNDGLTDKEEEFFNTDKNNPDTDNDSAPDGLEIMNLYSPRQGGGTKLAGTDLVKTYSNQTFKYSLFYPASFVPKVMPDSEESEIIISSDAGEFFSLVVQDNPETLAIDEWYKKQISEMDGQEIKKTSVDGQNAVWSLDGLTIYIGKDDKILAFTYNIGGGTVANFKSTYLMMIKSLNFLE